MMLKGWFGKYNIRRQSYLISAQRNRLLFEFGVKDKQFGVTCSATDVLVIHTLDTRLFLTRLYIFCTLAQSQLKSCVQDDLDFFATVCALGILLPHASCRH